MATSCTLPDLLPPEQIQQLADMLAPIMARGYGHLTIVVEKHQVRWLEERNRVRAVHPGEKDSLEE